MICLFNINTILTKTVLAHTSEKQLNLLFRPRKKSNIVISKRDFSEKGYYSGHQRKAFHRRVNA